MTRSRHVERTDQQRARIQSHCDYSCSHSRSRINTTALAMAATRPAAAQPAPPPSLVVAKTMLTAALMRPDPAAIAKDDIQTFHTLLDAALLACSPANIQV